LARRTPARKRDTHQVPREESNFFRDVIEEAKLKLIPFTQSRLRRGIKESARQVLNRLRFMNREIRHIDDEPGRVRAHNQYCRAGHRRAQGLSIFSSPRGA